MVPIGELAIFGNLRPPTYAIYNTYPVEGVNQVIISVCEIPTADAALRSVNFENLVMFF